MSQTKWFRKAVKTATDEQIVQWVSELKVLLASERNPLKRSSLMAQIEIAVNEQRQRRAITDSHAGAKS